MAAPTVHVENEDFSDSDVSNDDNRESDASENTSDSGNDDNASDSAEEGIPSSGLGNVISKILQKKVSSKSAVLAKGLTDRQIEKKRKLKQDDGETKEKKSKTGDSSDDSADSDASDSSGDENDGGPKIDPLRVKPDPLNKDHEKLLQRIATKGVVHLFNAVQKQQKVIGEKMTEAGSSEVKKSRALKTVTKGGFMDMLKQNDKSCKSDSTAGDNEPSWKILREDFMMGAKLKDWDKESDDGGSESDG